MIVATGPFEGRQRLSACLIVRNEEKRLGRCLRSLEGWVGEMVVVDTGSTDGSVAIAETAGARVVHRAWRQDFAWARNQSLEEATRPWALVIDADEVLTVTDPDAFARAVDGGQTAVTAFSMDCHDLRDDGSVGVAPVLRLFRRDAPDMRFRGEVHEQVVAVAEHRARVARADFVHLVHDGYTTAVMAEHGTRERNLPLARRMVASRPSDPFAWFCLGQSLVATAMPAHVAEGVEALQRALTCLDGGGGARDESYVASLHGSLVRALLATGQAAAAAAAAARGLADFPGSPDLRYLRGLILLQQGRLAEAESDLQFCLSPEAGQFFLRDEPGATSFAAYTQLGLCRVRQSRLADAEQCFRRAAAEAPPAYGLPSLLLGTLLLGRGAVEEAEPFLRSAAEARPTDVESRLKWAQALLAGRRLAEAQAALAPLAADPRVRSLLDEIARLI